MSPRTVTHWGAYEARVVDRQLVGLDPVAEDPEPSPMGASVASTIDSDLRILAPHVRAGWLEDGPGAREGRGVEPFVAVSWDEAVDLASHELARVSVDHGNEAIFGGSYGWGSAGRFHHPQSQIHRFLNLCGGYTASVNSYSMAALEVILPHVLGGAPDSIFLRAPTWEEIADHGEIVLAFGGLARKNSQVNAGGISRHRVMEAQAACRAAGVRFVNVSPFRQDVGSDLEADWVPVRPNCDVALMLGIAHTLVAENLHDRDFLDRCCVGFDRFLDYLMGATDGQPKSSSWAAAVSGVGTQEIEDLARTIAAKRTLVSVSWSVQRAHHGEQPYWMAVTLAAMSGSMGRPGGGFAAGLGAIHSIGFGTQRTGVAALPQGKNPVSSFIPVARIADMLLNPGERFDYDGATHAYPDIRLVYWCGGNPFHHHQDLHRLVKAWRRPETVICHEPFWNPLARFSDIVFPAALMVERNDIAAGYGDPVLMAMHKACDPPGEVRTDYEVFTALAQGLGLEDAFTEGRTADEWVRELYERTRRTCAGLDHPLPEFHEFWELGRTALPLAPKPDGDLEALRSDPENNPIPTPTGKIEIYSATIDSFGYDDCPGLPCWLEPEEWLGAQAAERFPLHLLTHQPSVRLHSQFDHGVVSQAAKVAGREPVLLSVEDAEGRGIDSGCVVRVFNDRGACLAGAVVTSDLRQGVALMATGAWFDPTRPGDVRALERHGNPNVLTLDRGTSRLAQGSSAQTALVEIERHEGPAPPLTVLTPP